MRKAFTIVELIIVVTVLGILAAAVLPQLQSHATRAKEAAAKSNLRLLRGVIELYAGRHNSVPPGYAQDDPQAAPSSLTFHEQTITKGDYFRRMPKNPFNYLDTIKVIANGGTLPENATGDYGWIYQPATKTIKLDWPNVDKDGIRYYDY